MENEQQSVMPQQPFLKWAGGKRRLLPNILPRLKIDGGRYYEPFLGAGAVFLGLTTDSSKIGSDINEELINVWLCVRDYPQELIATLQEMKNTKQDYLLVRSWDRAEDWPEGFNNVQRAARTIFLNKTGFNGLYRVNSRGEFNVPSGDQKNPRIADFERVTGVSRYLNERSAKGDKPVIRVSNFVDAVNDAAEGDTVYFDPPYLPASKSSSFVNYSSGGFSLGDHENLRDLALDLGNRGVRVLISNSNTPVSRRLYDGNKQFRIEVVSAARAIGASPASRGSIGEVLVSCGPAD